MRMTYKKTLGILVALNSITAMAQVGIGTINPNPSAVLDITSNNKGLLIPRVNLIDDGDQSTIANPEVSLLVYNLGETGSLNAGFYFWNGSNWEVLGIQNNNLQKNSIEDNKNIFANDSKKTFADFALNNEIILKSANVQTINLDEKHVSGIAKHSNGIAISSPGLYLITFTITVEGLNNDTILTAYFGQNNNALDNCIAKNTVDDNEIKTISFSRVVNITDSKGYNLYVRQSKGGSNIKILKEGTNLFLQKL